ncbi:MAG: hypothetical protein ABI791_15095 [Acidobacteriota bacterium]
MQRSRLQVIGLTTLVFTAFIFAAACGAPTGNTNLTAVNVNANISNSLANSNLNTSTTVTGATVDTREPDQYQATVKLSLETTAQGNQKAAAIPTIAANVARSGNDRMMEFNLPTNEKVIFLDKGGMSYLIFPNRKQYAELTKEALGFEMRRLMMPEQIVNQAKALSGMRLVGEESMNGRQVTKYAYQSATNTQTAAGTVAAESFLIVDKETGLPLRTETVAKSQNGNVQGVNGARVVTEMTDIKTTPDPSLFNLPTDFAKIDPETVKAQVNAVFQIVASVVGQMIQQAQQPAAGNTNTNSMAAPTATPAG